MFGDRSIRAPVAGWGSGCLARLNSMPAIDSCKMFIIRSRGLLARMSELPTKEIIKFGERLSEGVPGFAWAAILLSILLAFAFPNAREWVPVWAFSLAWLGNIFGHYADDWLYDPILGPESRKFPRKLYEVREELAECWEVPVTGIYKKAKHLSVGTEFWEKRVKLWIEFSKASRSFMFLGAAAVLWFAWLYVPIWVVPILMYGLVALLFVRMTTPWTGLKYWLSGVTLISLLFRWVVPKLPRWDWMGGAPSRLVQLLALILLVSTALYLGLRVFHNIRLYKEAKTIVREKRDGLLVVGQRVLPLRRVLLHSALGRDDTAIRRAEEYVQSEALLHVELRAKYGSLEDCNGESRDLQVHDRDLKKVHWVKKKPIRVPLFNTDEWSQVTPDLIIKFVSESGHDLEEITKWLNATL